MAQGHFILREAEHAAFQAILRKLLSDSYAKVVFLVDKNGTLLTSVGETEGFDTTSLASLAAGNIAATAGSPTSSGRRSSRSSSTRGSGTTCTSPWWRTG